MAVVTNSDYFGVIDEFKGTKSERKYIVASVTGIAGINMVACLANSVYIVMATYAISHEAAVIRHIGIGDVQPIGRVMTGIAFRCGSDMIQPLTACDSAIMTTGANADHVSMIDREDRIKGQGFFVVTGFAGIISVNVRRYRVNLTNGVSTVVTDNAVVDNIGVIDIGGGERNRIMTNVAFVGGGHMADFLAKGNDIIVTTATGTKDIIVVNRFCRREFKWRGVMAGDTIIGAGNMRGRLEGFGIAAVLVTTDTGTYYIIMIDPFTGNRRPFRRRFIMAAFAKIRARHVRRGFSAGGGSIVTG